MKKKLILAVLVLSLIATRPAFALMNWGDNDLFQQLKKVFNQTTAQTDAAAKIGGLTATGAVTADTVVATTSIGITGLTASRAVVTDSSKVLASSSTTSTELGYVNGVTSAIQTQMDLKAPLASPVLTGTPAIAAATGTSLTLTGNAQIQTSLLANGAYAPAGVGASITLNSSSTGLGGSSVPYKLIIKNIGGAGVDLTPGSILPNGLPGQTLFINISGVGSGTCQWLLTPTTKTGYTSITFTATKQFAILNYDATLGWVLGGTNATVNL